MNIIQQIELSSANFWAGAELTKSMFGFLKAEREIVNAGRNVGNGMMPDELAIITRTPEQRSSDYSDAFIQAGLVVYAAYVRAKNSDSAESYHLRNVRTPLEIISRSAEYSRNQAQAATAAALGLTYKAPEPSDTIPSELIPLYKELVEEIKSANINVDDLNNLLDTWLQENQNKVVDSAKNLLDGARKRFEQGGYAGDPAELIELRVFVEKAAA